MPRAAVNLTVPGLIPSTAAISALAIPASSAAPAPRGAAGGSLATAATLPAVLGQERLVLRGRLGDVTGHGVARAPEAARERPGGATRCGARSGLRPGHTPSAPSRGQAA